MSVARGIRYAADNGAKVINLSIGRENGGAAPVVTDAIRYAVGRGAFVVVASGNTRAEGNAAEPPGTGGAGHRRHDRGRRGRPHARPRVLLDDRVVRGNLRAGRRPAPGRHHRPASCSRPSIWICSKPSTGRCRSTVRRALIRSATPTSRAPRWRRRTSPGFAALLMQQGITSPAAIEAAMKQFATDKGPAGLDNSFGAGLINPRATLRGLGLAR